MNRRRRIIKNVFYYLTVILVSFELAFWVLGYRPYYNVDYHVTSSPEHPFWGDSLLGIRLHPGSYMITLNDSVRFSAEHQANGLRHTVDVKRMMGDSLGPDVHFFGCSFTYGYGVNDEETFASLTQMQLPWNRVYNHGVAGYGSCQSLLQVQSDSSLKAGDLVLLCFSSFHFDRNALTQSYRSDLRIGFENSSPDIDKRMKQARFPYLSACDEEISFDAWDGLYSNWSLRYYSPSINYFQTAYDQRQDAKVDQLNISACILHKLSVLCHERRLKLGIICLDQTVKTKILKHKMLETPWLDVRFDFENADLTNRPYDSHPNAKGHQFIFERIFPFIQDLIVE